MGLRCAARSTSMRDSIVLSIGDNLSEILASDKGRSSDPVTNAQLRRAAGLTAAAGISWRRRHIETGRNPTDQGSRIADDGELAPGETLRRTPAQRNAAFFAARRGAARACGLPHAAFAAELTVPTPKTRPLGVRALLDSASAHRGGAAERASGGAADRARASGGAGDLIGGSADRASLADGHSPRLCRQCGVPWVQGGVCALSSDLPRPAGREPCPVRRPSHTGASWRPTRRRRGCEWASQGRPGVGAPGDRRGSLCLSGRTRDGGGF